MAQPRENEQDQERDAIEDLELDDDAANDVSGGAYEPYLNIEGKKTGGPIKNP